MSEDVVLEEPPKGELLYRAATTRSVSFPARTIELVVIPYETEATVEHKGRLVVETIARGAFDGIERRARRVKVYRDHDRTRPVGRAVTFHPHRPEGLVADLWISKTREGDETLEQADDGTLDASAGFAPMPGGTRWVTRDRVRYDKCFLDHIAMTADPAYETARVLAVRSAADPPTSPAERTATPNLSRLEPARLLEEEAALDARWRRR